MLSWPWAEAGTLAAAEIANAAIAPGIELRTEYIDRPPGKFFGLLGNSLAKVRWKSTAKTAITRRTDTPVGDAGGRDPTPHPNRFGSQVAIAGNAMMISSKTMLIAM